MAKVSRDRLVALQGDEVAEVHPLYPSIFREEHGYGSPRHMELVKQGIYTKYHRKCFNPLRSYLEQQQKGKILPPIMVPSISPPPPPLEVE